MSSTAGGRAGNGHGLDDEHGNVNPFEDMVSSFHQSSVQAERGREADGEGGEGAYQGDEDDRGLSSALSPPNLVSRQYEAPNTTSHVDVNAGPMSTAKDNAASLERDEASEERAASVRRARGASKGGASEPVRETFCCFPDRYIYHQARQRGFRSAMDAEPVIRIVDAIKVDDVRMTSYIAYIVRLSSQSTEARRRYSDFVSLRALLARLHPTAIVPPIPSKHTLGEYAVKQSKANQDLKVIERRKRMLQVFLNRTASHPLLGADHIFHKFLDGDVSWAEVLRSPMVEGLPKSSLRGPALEPAIAFSQHPELVAPYSTLPLPTASQQLHEVDQRWLDSEVFTEKFSSYVVNHLERINRRLLRRWHDVAVDYQEMGAFFNGFHLNERGQLANSIERVGQAMDGTFLGMQQLVTSWNILFSEPLHEVSQFSQVIGDLLKYRHQRALQFESVRDSLEEKKARLGILERSEHEAKRLEDALRDDDDGPLASSVANANRSESRKDFPPKPPPEGYRSDVNDAYEPSGGLARDYDGRDSASMDEPTRPPHDLGHSASNGISARSASAAILRTLGFSSTGLSGPGSSFGSSLTEVLDVDSEVSRRNTIGRTKDSITELEQHFQLVSTDLKATSQAIQADLDRFQRQKVADMRDLMRAFSRMHISMAKKALREWKAAKAEVDKIPTELSQEDL